LIAALNISTISKKPGTKSKGPDSTLKEFRVALNAGTLSSGATIYSMDHRAELVKLIKAGTQPRHIMDFFVAQGDDIGRNGRKRSCHGGERLGGERASSLGLAIWPSSR
jgi:hypothetical protein